MEQTRLGKCLKKALPRTWQMNKEIVTVKIRCYSREILKKQYWAIFRGRGKSWIKSSGQQRDTGICWLRFTFTFIGRYLDGSLFKRCMNTFMKNIEISDSYLFHLVTRQIILFMNPGYNENKSCGKILVLFLHKN